MNSIQEGKTYRHFKGKLYKVLVIAEHTETGEQMVIYQALHNSHKYYVRPLSMFASPVDTGKYPNATQYYWFEAVDYFSDGRHIRKIV